MNWLHHDHKNFESAVCRCRAACDKADWAQVRNAFDELVSIYRSHVRIEEEVLFPAYNKRPDASTTPTDSLKEDHQQISSLIDHIAASLGKDDGKTIAEDFSLLYRVIIKHHEKEEKIFLPMASEVLFCEKDALLADIEGQSRSGE